MINRDKFEALSEKARQISPEIDTSDGSIDLDKLDLNALLTLRMRIDEKLPARALADIDLEEELVIQFQQTKKLLSDVLDDEEVPPNQKAQVANTCSSLLAQLTKMQSELYAAERVKALEAALIKALLTLPEATQKAFFVEYERLYGALKQ